MNAFVASECVKWLSAGKIVGLLGGDHSTPLGFMQALSKHYPSFGILQIDAHMDLRIAFEGFTYSHASIMYNSLKINQVSKLVQVGIRDYCEEEIQVMRNEGNRVKTYFDDQLKFDAYQGKLWHNQVNEIIAQLPQHVYVSFDIDGLDPKLCPNTGTPVAGGLEYHQAIYLLNALAKSGKEIIGFDLNEVAPGEDEWDANVGARLLFKLCVFAGISKGLFPAAR
jgi:agmatinase